MQLCWFKLLAIPLNTLFLLSTLFIISCDSDDDKPNVCHISTVKGINSNGAPSIVTHDFVYNSENKIEAILLDGDGWQAKRDLEYDDKGMLVKVVNSQLSDPQQITVYRLIYEGHDKPKEVHAWEPGVDLSGPPTDVFTFSHDDKNRLVNIGTSYRGTVYPVIRYEYIQLNNVAKMFFNSGAKESLYLENLSFDTKLKYYSLAPELEILYVYIYRIQPGVNNPLTARLYPLNNAGPFDITYHVTYDQDGRIISNQISPPPYTYTYNHEFDGITYNCP